MLFYLIGCFVFAIGFVLLKTANLYMLFKEGKVPEE